MLEGVDQERQIVTVRGELLILQLSVVNLDPSHARHLDRGMGGLYAFQPPAVTAKILKELEVEAGSTSHVEDASLRAKSTTPLREKAGLVPPPEALTKAIRVGCSLRKVLRRINPFTFVIGRRRIHVNGPAAAASQHQERVRAGGVVEVFRDRHRLGVFVATSEAACRKERKRAPVPLEGQPCVVAGKVSSSSRHCSGPE
jgi:hypothetical protein